jgi:hypothetical protein
MVVIIDPMRDLMREIRSYLAMVDLLRSMGRYVSWEPDDTEKAR